MRNLLRRLRGGFGIGLIWAIGGAFVGGMIELVANFVPGIAWIHSVDMWPQTLAIPAFLGGLSFSLVLGIAAHHRRFEELSMLKFGAWGALGGALFGGLLVATGIAGVLFIVPAAVMSAVAATGSLAIARMGERHDRLAAGADDHAPPPVERGMPPRSGDGG